VRKVHAFAFIGFLLVMLALPSCGKERVPTVTEKELRPPAGHENFVMPEENPDSKGGFQKSFPKAPRGRP